jgi:hypothetical protein
MAANPADQQLAAPEKEVHLKLVGGSVVVAHQALHEASGAIKDFLKTSPVENRVEELPINQEHATVEDLNFMNSIAGILDAAELKEHADDRSYWVENISKKKDQLAPLAQDVHSNDLIRRANLADYLIFHAAIHFCTYVLADRAQNLNLAQIREMLNEQDDFSEEERKLIAEFADIQNA